MNSLNVCVFDHGNQTSIHFEKMKFHYYETDIDVRSLFIKTPPDVIVSVGCSETLFENLMLLPLCLRRRWIHVQQRTEICASKIRICYEGQNQKPIIQRCLCEGGSNARHCIFLRQDEKFVGVAGKVSPGNLGIIENAALIRNSVNMGENGIIGNVGLITNPVGSNLEKGIGIKFQEEAKCIQNDVFSTLQEQKVVMELLFQKKLELDKEIEIAVARFDITKKLLEDQLLLMNGFRIQFKH